MKRSLKSSLVLFLTALVFPALVLTGCGGGGGSTPNPAPGNTAPVANAGVDQSVATGSTVTLNGGASADADGDPLTYNWTLTTKPSGSNAVLSSTTAVNPTFTADLDGSYVVSLVVNDGTVNSAADSVTVTAAVAILNLSINQAAAVAIGQANLTSGLSNRGASVAANTISDPYGNPVVYNGKLYLSDYGNARVLGFDTIPTTNGVSANFVIGQTDFLSAVTSDLSASGMAGPQTMVVANGKLFLVDYDFNRLTIYNSVPTLATSMPGTADLVIGQPDFGIKDPVLPPTDASLIFPESAIVAGGKLIISDAQNNRVLIWNSIPSSNGAAADVVLGQFDFTHNTANDENQDGVVDATPSAKTLDYPTGVWSDGTRLVVADGNNNRVLIWDQVPTTNQAAANHVLGQADFTSNLDGSIAPTDSSLSFPYAVFCKKDQLFVTDYNNNRVLIWDNFPTTDQAPANVVLGQINFGHNAPNDDGTGNSLTDPAATTLSAPSGLYVDGRKLFVADGGNNRYLIYDSQDTP